MRVRRASIGQMTREDGEERMTQKMGSDREVRRFESKWRLTRQKVGLANG